MNKSIPSFRWILGGIIGLFLGLSTQIQAQSLEANDDHRKIKEDEVSIVNVLENDVLVGSSIASISGPMHGSLDTTGQQFKYTPSLGYYGTDTISYVLCNSLCDTALVTFEIEPVFFPKVIQGVSPNSDGINDVFSIEDVDYQLLDVSVTIFNRWGTPIFSEDHYDQNNPDKSWHGQSNNGEEVVDGTYFYIVEIPAIEFKDSNYLVFISYK